MIRGMGGVKRASDAVPPAVPSTLWEVQAEEEVGVGAQLTLAILRWMRSRRRRRARLLASCRTPLKQLLLIALLQTRSQPQ